VILLNVIGIDGHSVNADTLSAPVFFAVYFPFLSNKKLKVTAALVSLLNLIHYFTRLQLVITLTF